ncbi:MAG: cyclase family protein [Actinobacteria bacterium]|nr:MAG: cyclase family protein [Actinomycetota bacterium]
MAPPDAPVPALPLQDRLLRRRDRRVHERLTGGVTGLDELLAADRLVDLTQPLGESTILWPGSHPFETETTVDHDAHGAYARDLALPEHAGTHIDAPAHFHRGGATADLIPLATLVRPAVRLDVRELVGDDASFALSAEDIEDLEREDGLIRPDSAVLVDTGWDRYLDDPVRYSGGETTSFPGIGADAARLLVARGIVGIGIDTMGVDPGGSLRFAAHRITMPAGLWHAEGLVGLERVPARGAWVVVGALPIVGGSGAPARIFAVIPP